MAYYDYTHKSGYGHNSHVYKVETYVEEVRKPRVVEYRYPSYPTKIDPTYTYNHDRPPEVDNLITKILTEVNGPPTITSISDSGTYQGNQRAPVRVESKNYYSKDPWYTSYPSHQDYGSQYHDPSTMDHRVPKHHYQPPQQDLDYPSNQWSRYSHPEYTQSPKNESYGYQPPTREPYASKPGTIRTFGVPRTNWGASYKSDSPKYGGFQNQGAPKNQWGDAPTNPSNFRPEVPRDERDPNKRWGDSPTNSQPIRENGVPKGYRVPIFQYDESPMNFHDGYEILNNPTLSKPETLRGQETLDNKSYGSPVRPYDYAGDYRDPDKQWGSYAKMPTRQDYGVPSKPQSPKDDTAPYTQWGGSPVKSQTRHDYGVPSRSESPKDHRGPYSRWGGSPEKSQIRQDYEVPVKPKTPKDHRGPYTERCGSPKNSLNPGNNDDVLNNHPNLSSDPNVYQHPGNMLRNSPGNSPKFRGYGDPSDHLWDSPPNPVRTQPPNTQFPSQPKPYNEQDHSPMNQQTIPSYRTPSILSGKSLNHSDEPQPPFMTCKDGVCTLNDRPKVTQNPYDEPKDSHIRNYPKDTTTDHVQNGGRSSPCSLNQPKKDQQNTSANWMNSTSANNNNTRTNTPLGKATNNNIEEPLGQLNIREGSSPKVGVGRLPNPTTTTNPGVGLSAPIHPRPKTENPKESTDTYIDSKEAAKRYGGLGVPSRPYSSGEDQSTAITSIEALEKYNGSIVPK